MNSEISLTEAARRWTVSRTTLYKSVNNGELTTSGKGKSRTVNVSEMVRVYGEPKVNSEELTLVTNGLQTELTNSEHRITLLEQKIEHLNEKVTWRDEQILDLRDQVKRLQPIPLLEQLKNVWKK